MSRRKKLKRTIDLKPTNGSLGIPQLEDLNEEVKEVKPVAKKMKKISGRSPGQKAVIKSIQTKDLTLVSGVAGTGKTLMSVGVGIELLNKGEIDKILITRPLVSAGEAMGFLPGGIDEKTQPFLVPIYDSFLKFVDKEQLDNWKKDGTIEIGPIGFLRGRSLERMLIICDEMQNATVDQIKMVITRLGEGSRLVLNGDPTQSDLPWNQQGGFDLFCDRLADMEEISIIYLTEEDIQRHPLIKKLLPRIGFLSDKDLKDARVGQRTKLENERPPRTFEDFYRGYMDYERDDDAEL